MAVLLIGTLDTKGTEFDYVKKLLEQRDIPVLVADTGVLGPATIPAAITREEIFAAAGARYSEVKSTADRGQAIKLAAQGAAQVAAKLYREGKISGVLSLGGSAGTTIGTAAMRALPIGVPKLMVSTLASGQVQPYVGTRDILMMYSVVDLCGINRISRKVLDNAAAAMIGMVQAQKKPIASPSIESDKKIIAATMFGVTTPCVEAARKVIEAAGYEVLVFHATGTGGRTMEGLIRDGLVAGVLDITTTELADEHVGGVMAAGPDRLTAAAIAGIPQVISVGAVDMVNFGQPETIPEKFRDRRFYHHNPTVTLMRTTPEENDRIGQQITEKACASNSPTAILLPLQGVSAIDAPGKPFWWPEADAALFQSIRNWVYGVELIEVDAHINDPLFAETAAKTMLRLLST